MSRSAGCAGVRDQATTPFGPVLVRLCAGTRATGVALVDVHGETVDYATSLPPEDLRIAAAECQLVMNIARTPGGRPGGGAPYDLVTVRARHATVTLVALPAGYSLALFTRRRSFLPSPRAIGEAIHDACREAALPLPAGTPTSWSSVEVQADPRNPLRPQAIWAEGAWRATQIIGKYASDLDTPLRERSRHRTCGYRVLLEDGREFALVREPLGKWYAAEPSDYWIGRGDSDFDD